MNETPTMNETQITRVAICCARRLSDALSSAAAGSTGRFADLADLLWYERDALDQDIRALAALMDSIREE